MTERGKWCSICDERLCHTWPATWGGDGMCRACFEESMARETDDAPLPAACTPGCWARPQCTTCWRDKKPWGRDAGMIGGGCDTQCPGYNEEPKPGHLWPGEGAWFGTIGKGADR